MTFTYITGHRAKVTKLNIIKLVYQYIYFGQYVYLKKAVGLAPINIYMTYITKVCQNLHIQDHFHLF